MEYNEETISSMFCDPFYCLPKFAGHYSSEHKPMVTKEEWIEVAIKFIEDHGPEDFLKRLIKNLEGRGDHLVAANMPLG